MTEHASPCPHCGGKLHPGGYLIDPTAPAVVTTCTACRRFVHVPVPLRNHWQPEFTAEERAFMRDFAAGATPTIADREGDQP